MRLKRHTRALLVSVTAVVTIGVGAVSAPAHATTRLHATVSPLPGTATAEPATTISFRDIAPANIGAITVTGSATGPHTGTWVAHSDGLGASFDPATPFASGEVVTVRTSLDLGTFSFTVAHESSVTTTAVDSDEVVAPPAQKKIFAAAPAGPFVTRPDLNPPIATVESSNGTPAPGVLAVTAAGAQSGPLLMDNQGQPIWYQPEAAGVSAINASIQTYRGSPVLAWWHGQNQGGFGFGTYELVDQTYHHVATISAGNGLSADLHDMQITPQNTALILAYDSVAMDLTPYGGVANGSVLQLVIQEIDIATGAVMHEWDSLNDVPLTKSVQPAPTTSTSAWDYLHGNAVALDTDGNVLVSSRHSSSIFKLHRDPNVAAFSLMWTLGRGGDFAPSFDDADWFAYQHDVRRRSDGNISVFHNGSAGNGLPSARPYTRGLEMSVDEVHKTVSIVREVRHNPDVRAGSQGDFRELPGGHDLMGWGAIGRVTEYDDATPPNAVLDLTWSGGTFSYRTVRAVWDGRPTAPPDLVLTRDNGLTVNAKVSWNGATDVAEWVMRAGPGVNDLATVATVPRTGFETSITANTGESMIVVEAHDSHGTVLGSVTTVLAAGAPTPHNTGYWVANDSACPSAFGTAAPMICNTGLPGPPAIVGVARASATGVWLAHVDGSITAIGALSFGSLAGKHLNAPIVGIAPTPDGGGYWMVASDGGIFTFGDAHYFGSEGGKRLNQPVVGMAPTRDGKGYWLAARDGGVFTFGDAQFRGSKGGSPLNQPVVGIAGAPDSVGYWLVARDGGIFTFGTAKFLGSEGAKHLNAPIVGMATTGDGRGYWLLGHDGGVFTFGIAQFKGAGAANAVAISHD